MAAQLVPLPEVERLSPRCIRILGGNPGKFTLQGTNTYLVGTGRRRLLIDTAEGKPAWIDAVRRTLAEEGASVSAALITHWHPDHVGGIGDLLALSPDTKIYKCQADADADAGAVAGAGGSTMADIADGQVFEAEGASLTAVHTPGHTVDHMAFVLREEDAMFTGDNVLGQGTAVFEELAVYLRSLARMKPLFKGRAYPGHGPVLEDGPAKIAEYIHHRAQREEQVLATLQSQRDGEAGAEVANGGTWTAIELVRVIYRDVREDLHPAAERGLLQILDKLEKEGRVQRLDGGRWKLKSTSAL
ncbi:uncharacterized protein E0L32_009180 [Thyridium curvatum]|uniref:Metallo-beta-lactamase domain-containing protein n=1 Tax=Thyridium curvatum TaxID=1093900 RepID=A0A507AX66_9PEZI|nr:uncharacterized protein E0L32_009180 [Thyridium curvatum]TPX09579.1 hypothetical protein E0L32_009180 [Thyridium curvatum]